MGRTSEFSNELRFPFWAEGVADLHHCWRRSRCVCECVCMCGCVWRSPSCLEQNLYLILKDIFIGYKILGWKRFSFSTLILSSRSLPACIVSEKSVVLVTFVLLCHSSPHPWLLLKFSPFWLILSNLIMIYPGVIYVCVLILLGVYQGSWIYKMELSSNLKSFQISFL